MNDASSRGKFVWYDLMNVDPKRAVPFYTSVLGWGTQAYEGMGYTMWTANGTPIGGIGQGQPSGGPHWLAYIFVEDVDAAVQQVQSLGGRTHVPAKDIPTVGRYAVVADPHGAVFAVFTPADGGSGSGAESDPKMGEFSWHELMTTDYAKGFAFYQTLFGWEKIAEHDMGPLGIYLIFGRGGRQLGGMFTTPPDVQMPPNWMQYVRVESADTAAERVTANGGQVLNGPMDVPGGDRIAQCTDPQGAAFAVHARGA